MATANVPTIATPNSSGSPVSISGITTNDQGRPTAHPNNMTRRRPTRSHRLADNAAHGMQASPPSTPTNKTMSRE